VISTDILSGELGCKMRFPVLVHWKQTIRRTIAKFAVLLIVSSIALPATAFSGSHSTGRIQSRSSSHVRSHKGSHRTRRTTSSGLTRNRHDRIRRSSAAKHSFERQQPCPSTGRTSGRCPATWSIMSSRWSVAKRTHPATCNGKQLRRAKPRTRQRGIADCRERECV
jgi:hypothetical protein